MKVIILLVLAVSIVSCNGGGASGGGEPSSPTNGFVNNPAPAPNVSAGSYKGTPYTNLSQPTDLSASYPSAYLPSSNGNALQIAYGSNLDEQIADLTALVMIDNGSNLCSATPIKYDAASNSTFLISAAHCFVDSKESANTVSSKDLSLNNALKVFYGVGNSVANWIESYSVKAVYLPQDYCLNATFASDSVCHNFTPQFGVANGQGNDIAIIQVKGRYANPLRYPLLVQASEYPDTYTMAPVLSLGYGINTQTPIASVPACELGINCAVLFYTANYQYWQQDATGYHYLYNSYYAANNSSPGYSVITCGGDSGGGDLFWNGKNWLLLSEHTYGPYGACGTFYNYLPTAATNVSAYYVWIKSIIDNSDPVVNCINGNIANCVTKNP